MSTSEDFAKFLIMPLYEEIQIKNGQFLPVRKGIAVCVINNPLWCEPQGIVAFSAVISGMVKPAAAGFVFSAYGLHCIGAHLG